MKLHASLLVTLLVAAACGSPKPPKGPDQPPTATPTHGEIPCTAELALACTTDSADGCLDGRTLFHVCVPQGETAGPPCEQEIAKVCAEGAIDACLATPALAASHVCVLPNAEPAPAANACPAGQGWVVPGCGGGTPAFEAGCYADCDADGACATGFTCAKVTVNPCANSACDACGAEGQICLPAS